jgi:hypothetical protein
MFGFGAIIGAIPIIGKWLIGPITSLSKAYFDAKVRLVQARIGGDVEIAKKLVSQGEVQAHENTTRLGIIASNKLLTILLIAFALPLVYHEWEVVVWDKSICKLIYGAACSTDPIGGLVGDWANTVIYFLFGAPTAIGIGKMFFGRNKQGE